MKYMSTTDYIMPYHHTITVVLNNFQKRSSHITEYTYVTGETFYISLY